jgi:Putative transmembrane protein (PGPGW)
MSDFLARIAEHKPLTITLGLVSVGMFVGSLVAVPFLIARAPRDFFSAEQTPKVLKNLAGALLLLAGLAMLLLPGQGILTLIVGLALLDLPGKHALLVRMARRPGVMRTLNYLRQRARREPFDPPA